MPVALLCPSPFLLSSLVVPVSSLGLAPHPHPASSCSQRRLAVVVLSFHPRPTPRTVASSGGGFIVSPPRSRRAPHFHPASSCSRWRLGVPSSSWCQLVLAVRRPTVHPASRGSQRWCGCRGCRLMFRQLEKVAMWQDALTSCLSHFPGLPDTSYAVLRMGRRVWDSPCCQKVVVT
jgi:hypothetical protein